MTSNSSKYILIYLDFDFDFEAYLAIYYKTAYKFM